MLRRRYSLDNSRFIVLLILKIEILAIADTHLVSDLIDRGLEDALPENALTSCLANSYIIRLHVERRNPVAIGRFIAQIGDSSGSSPALPRDFKMGPASWLGKSGCTVNPC